MAYGRGGAGNILQAKEDSKKVVEDVEANHTISTSTSSSPPPSVPSDYSHMGRGGAGNWFTPASLHKDGTFTQSADSTALPTSSKPQISTPWHPDGQELPVGRSGRGGAGNFMWKSSEEIRREKEGRELEDMKRKVEVSEGVEKDVEAQLSRPPGARLGGDRSLGRGW